MNSRTLPEENRTLFELLQNYQADDTEANGEAVLHELRNGEAKLYVPMERGTRELVMLKVDGKPIAAFDASVDLLVDVAEENHRDSTKEVRLIPCATLVQFMLSRPITVMWLHRGRADEMGIVYDKDGWRIAALGKKMPEWRKPRTSLLTPADRKGRRK